MTPEATPTVAEVTPLDLRKRASKNLSNSDRNSILHSLLKNMKAGGNNKLCVGAIKKAAHRFDIAPRTVSRIWNRYLQTVDSNGWGGDVSRRNKNSGRKQIDTRILDNLSTIPLEQRVNLRSLSQATGISLSTLHRRKIQGDVRVHTSAILPHLSEKQKHGRIEWVLSHIRANGRFRDFYDTIAVDEKWFNLMRCGQRYYLSPHEEDPI